MLACRFSCLSFVILCVLFPFVVFCCISLFVGGDTRFRIHGAASCVFLLSCAVCMNDVGAAAWPISG